MASTVMLKCGNVTMAFLLVGGWVHIKGFFELLLARIDGMIASTDSQAFSHAIEAGDTLNVTGNPVQLLTCQVRYVFLQLLEATVSRQVVQHSACIRPDSRVVLVDKPRAVNMGAQALKCTRAVNMGARALKCTTVVNMGT